MVKEHPNISVYHKRYVIYALGIPLLAAIAPLVIAKYGNSDGWCWVEADEGQWRNTVLRLSIYYIPLWLVIPYNLMVYIKVIQKINKEIANVTEEEFTRRQLVRKLFFYPLVLIICQTPVTITRIHDYVETNPKFELVLISGIGICINGLLNAIVYGCNKSVKILVYNW